MNGDENMEMISLRDDSVVEKIKGFEGILLNFQKE
jgi:hypothetical protein